MSTSDIAIGPVGIPMGAPLINKPSYLLTLEEGYGKAKHIQYFVTIDKPELQNGFVQVKGMFMEDILEKEIILKYAEILAHSPRTLILEIFFPWHRIHSIRSLIFKAK